MFKIFCSKASLIFWGILKYISIPKKIKKETQKEDVGFIAQEVEKVIPEVVETTKGFINTDEDMNRKTISYPKLIPYLVDTIQELTKRIEKLEKKVK